MGDGHDDDLIDEVARRLESSGLDSEAQLLVLAAALGDVELVDALGGGSGPAPVAVRQSAGELPRTYLTEIAVEGFRGIAGAARIGLSPGPGLTLVIGRNGSGKSSFAEAAELAVTGTTNRWSAGRSRVWQEGWRNVHHHGPRSIHVRLSTDGDPVPTTVSVRWDDGATLAGGTATIQRKGDPVRPLAAAGWRGALATYRPFLSYNELGGLLEDGPSKLYDAISQVLGLELLSAAEQRLVANRKGLEEGARAVRAEAKRLGDLVRALSDPRAVTCAAALTHRGGWDLDVIDSVAGSSAIATNDPELAMLTTLAAVEPPDPAAAHAAAAELREALSTAAQLRDSDAGRARDLADLLERALEVHDPASTTCEVCGTAGAADEAWAVRTREEIARLRDQSVAAEAAARRLAVAVEEARSLIGPPPGSLSTAIGVDASAASAAWAAWSEAPEDAAGLADHLDTRAPVVAAAVSALRSAAREELARREDRWAPTAAALAGWASQARAARAGEPRLVQLKAAIEWIRATTTELRNERFAPIAAEVRATWGLLRQQSNVSIDELVLTGAGNRRKVDLKVTVDDVEGAALAVMSQGELHAMALSLFLPRASLPESPFGFVVIDDPVQSMDAARVDGLARALAAVAETRQVIVFTHDERLPQAARLLRLPARVLEVTRGAGSAVTIRNRSTPAEDYLDDARAILHTEGFPVEARRRVIPGLCRSSLEAACMDVSRRRRLGRGSRHDEVEALVRSVTKPLPWLALALFDDDRRAGDVLGEVNRRWGTRFGDVLQALRAGAHRLVDEHPDELVRDTAALVERVQALA